MIKKGCVALSVQLHTGIDFLMGLPIDDLNEFAEQVNRVAEEVAKRGQK